MNDNSQSNDKNKQFCSDLGLIKDFHKHFLISFSWTEPGISLEFLPALLRSENVNGWEWWSSKGRVWSHNLIVNHLWLCFSWLHSRTGKDLKKSPDLASCLYPEAGCLNCLWWSDARQSPDLSPCHSVSFCLNCAVKIYPTKISLGLIKTHSFPPILKTYSSKNPWEPSLWSTPHLKSQPALQQKVILSFTDLWRLPLTGSTPPLVDSYPLLKYCHWIWSQCITKLFPEALLT